VGIVETWRNYNLINIRSGLIFVIRAAVAAGLRIRGGVIQSLSQQTSPVITLAWWFKVKPGFICLAYRVGLFSQNAR
jgi:hypothetical protein